MRRILFAAVLMLSTAAHGAIHVKCDSNSFQSVRISSKGINRIVFPEKITEVVFSKEKPFKHTVEGKNLFLKVLTKWKAAEYYVILADGSVCQMLFSPDSIEPQVVFVDNPEKKEVERIKKALSFERVNKYEEMMKKLILSGINEEPPPGYTFELKNIQVEDFKEYKRNLISEMKGALYTVRIYLVKAKEHVRIDEKNFIDSDNTRAVTVLRHELMPGEETRVIVVEGNVERNIY